MDKEISFSREVPKEFEQEFGRDALLESIEHEISKEFGIGQRMPLKIVDAGQRSSKKHCDFCL